jgi:hypothetical protein
MTHAVRAALMALVLAALAASATATAGAAPRVHAARSCHLTRHEQRHLGAAYITSLSVRHTSCSNGKAVVRAYHECRKAHGWKGRCGHRVKGFSCKRHIQDSSPVQYDAKVTCRRGGKRVTHTYTQNK